MTQNVTERICLAAKARDYAELRKIFKEHPEEARGARTADKGWPVLILGVMANDAVMTRIFLENGGGVDDVCKPFNFTALMAAMKYADISVINLLLEFKADASLQDTFNLDTPLHYAVFHNNLDGAKALIRAGCDINATNNFKETPLQTAAKTGTLELAECLLESGARLDIRENYGNTALHLAALYERQDAGKILVRSGCDINATNNFKETPLHLALNRRLIELAECLLENGARRDIHDQRGETPRDIAVRIAREGHPTLLDIFERACQKIKRAAVESTPAPLPSAPKIILRKKGGAS